MQVQSVRINKEQVRKIAQVIKELPAEDQGLNFYSFKKGNTEIVASDMYPSKGHQKTQDFFSFACLHQYGFWHASEKGYEKPLIGLMGGKEVKGSDLLWKSLKKALDKNEEIFNPESLASLSKKKLAEEIFVDDKGTIPFRDFERRHRLTNEYGDWLVENKTSPKQIVDLANDTDTPLRTFLDQMKQVPGFAQDPLEKKSLLLAMALANRPENFLQVKDSGNWQPIVDYHLARLALRLGLVEIDKAEREINKARFWTTEESEKLIRKAVYEAVQEIIKESGRPMSLIDRTMWLARRYCPEMTEPDCPKCIFSIPCKKDKELFQPVLDTIDY